MKISELEKLEKEATPGPWTHDDGQVGACSDTADLKDHKEINPEDPKYDRFGICWNSFPVQYGCECGKYNSDKDGEFIAEFRNNAKALIDVAKAAKAVVAFDESGDWRDIELFSELFKDLRKSVKELENDK